MLIVGACVNGSNSIISAVVSADLVRHSKHMHMISKITVIDKALAQFHAIIIVHQSGSSKVPGSIPS